MPRGGQHKEDAKILFLDSGFKQKKDGTFAAPPLKSKWIKYLKTQQKFYKDEKW